MTDVLKNGDFNVTRSEENSLVHDDEDRGFPTKPVDTNEHVYDINDPPEGGWGWLVCFASFWTNGTVFGILNIFGILYVELIEEFKDENDIFFKLSWIGSLQIATTFFMSLFSGILVDQFGIQLVSGIGAVLAASGMLISSFVNKLELLYLTYGIIVGLGSSLIYTPSMTILGHYFRKRLGLVNGFVAFGSAVFTLVLSFVLPVLLKFISLRNCMRVLSGLFATLIVCPFIWKPRITKKRHNQSISASRESVHPKCECLKRNLKRVINVDLFQNRGYVIWLVASPIALLGYFIPFVHIVNHSREAFPGYNPDILVTCIGGVSGVSRLISGKLADSPSMNRVWIQQISFVMLGVATSLIPFVNHYGFLVALACIMGIADGCFICMLGPIAYDLLGPEGMGQGLGTLLGVISVPLTAGPPLAGWLRGLLGTYDIAFLVAGLPPILGACILFLMPDKLPSKGPMPMLSESIAAMSRDHLDHISHKDWQSRSSLSLRSGLLLEDDLAKNNAEDILPNT